MPDRWIKLTSNTNRCCSVSFIGSWVLPPDAEDIVQDVFAQFMQPRLWIWDFTDKIDGGFGWRQREAENALAWAVFLRVSDLLS